MKAPYLTLAEVSTSDDAEYRGQVALDEVCSWWREHGATCDELRERLLEALDRTDEDAEGDRP